MTTLEHLRITNRAEATRPDDADWGYVGLGVALVVVLALATPILRAWASLGWG